jgi:hypothetical protein
MKLKLLAFAIPSVLTMIAGCNHPPQTRLAVTYGSGGIETITYDGVVLENTKLYPTDKFYIGHLKMTDLSGGPKKGGEYGWGENNVGRKWSARDKSWDYLFPWGSIHVQYQQDGEALNVKVTEHNRADSGVILCGASIVPFTLHFAQTPSDFSPGPYPGISDNYTSPGVVAANYKAATALLVVPDAEKPLYAAYLRQPSPGAFAVVVSSTAPDDLATFQPHLDRPVMPGQSDQFTVSLRFLHGKQTLQMAAADAFRSWNRRWPSTLDWKDRRAIGAVFLASSPGAGSRPDPANPRRYFANASTRDIDIRTPTGLARLQQKILASAHGVVENLRRLNGQGAVTWDLEGEQYPQETSYVCSPDQIAAVAPEMESVINDRGSPYAGMKLDDAYFRIIRNAGFRVGVCIRPQQFTQGRGSGAEQVQLSSNQIANELIRKARYAHDRWGATLFYIDSSVGSIGDVIDPTIVQTVSRAVPDSLLIPEETTPRYYSFSAGFRSLLFHGDTGTPPAIYNYYPKAFSVVMINDVAAEKLKAARKALTESTRRGDILMVHAAYWQSNNSVVRDIYSDASAKTNTTHASLAVAKTN